MKPFRTLFARLLLGTVLSVVLALAVVALTVPRMAENLLLESKERELTTHGIQAGSVVSAYLTGALPEAEAKAFLMALSAPGDTEAWIVDRAGLIVLDSSRAGAPVAAADARSRFGHGPGWQVRGNQLAADMAACILAGQPWSTTGSIWPYADPVVSVGVPVLGPGQGVLGAILLNSPVSGVAETAAALRRDLFLAAGVGLLASLGAAVVLGRSVTRPIREMTGMAGRIADGDLEARAPDGGPGEVGGLGRSLNTMAVRLAASREEERRLVATRRDLVANVSHDLRSPITAIRGFIEPLLDGTVSDEPMRRRYLETARAETEALGVLVTDLVELTRLEAGLGSLKLSEVDVGQLMAEAGARYAMRSEETGITLKVSASGELPPLVADEGRVTRAVANLLDNAFKFTPRGGEIRLSAAAAEEAGGGLGPAIVIAVADNGPGISPEDLPRVWERFYKADRSRSRQTDGSGLGLAIVKEMAEAHGGRVEVESETGRGSEFRVYLPLRAAR